MDDPTFPCEADSTSDPTFESALVRNRGPKVKKAPPPEPEMPNIDLSTLHAQLMKNRPRVEDLPF